MMNAAAVLPAGAAMAFTGNAATISGAAISDNSAPGGFSEMLGAMVSGGRQSAGKSADAPVTEGQTAIPGEILSGLTELEESAEELKQLLKTAELTGYMQAAVVQMTDDVSTADNAGLTQALADVEGMQSVVQTTVQNSTDPADAPRVDEGSVQILQKREIQADKTTESDFAEIVQATLAENADVTARNTLQSETTDTSSNVDKGISDNRIDMTVSEEVANNGYSGETDIKATTYDPDGSIGNAEEAEKNVVVSKPADMSKSVSVTDESKQEAMAIVGVSDDFADVSTSEDKAVDSRADSNADVNTSEAVTGVERTDNIADVSTPVVGKPDDITADSKGDVVNTDSKTVDLSTAGKTYHAEADTVAGAKVQKDIVKMTFEKTTDTVTNEAKQEVTVQADNVPRVAYAKRNVEVKSDELKAIIKGTEATKSDSDLESEQKVTDKNAVSDMSARSSDVFARTESRFDDDGQPMQTVRVPINDMASFVSEHAPKANGKSTMTVVLTPETLGKITIRMVNESGKLTVEILTETQAAKELLQAKSEQLAYALKNDNVELTSYKVETSQAELFQRDFDGSSKNPYRQQSHSQQKDDTDDFDSLLGEIQAMG